MKKFLCNKDCNEFPESKKGNIYYGEYDKYGTIWIIDEWWIEQGITKEGFDLKSDGTYIKYENEIYFEVIK